MERCSSAANFKNHLSLSDENEKARQKPVLELDRVSIRQGDPDHGLYMDTVALRMDALAMGARHKILEKYNFYVPRYTSFPPATLFKDVEETSPYLGWLSSVDASISLYIHIPFCARLCHYCGCNMRVVNTYQPVQDYLDVLKAEMALLRDRLPPNVRISRLHFGGGSPTIIRSADFSRLVKSIADTFVFEPGMEFSVEADPRNLGEAKIAAYARSGVNRISLGVQDFNEEVLALINRPQPFHVSYRALQLCKSYGIENINFDLMYGLPGQTQDTILKTLDLALTLKPSRIAYFGYAHVPWMKRHMNLMPENRLPAPGDRYVLQESGARLLEDGGYVPVGIDHFCRPEDSLAKAVEKGELHRNFQGYTDDRAQSLVGLGASSISSFSQGYAQNIVNTRLYMESIKNNISPVHKVLEFKESDLPVKKIIEDLMCYMRVDLAKIREDFSLAQNAFHEEMDRLKTMEQDGLVTVKGDVVEINPDYRVLARVVCEAFDPYAIKDISLRRHAQAI